MAITVGLVAGSAYADNGPDSGAVASPTQQQALDANQTVRNYILAHPDQPVPGGTKTVAPTTDAPSATETTAAPSSTSSATDAPATTTTGGGGGNDATTSPVATAGGSTTRKYASGMPWSDGGFFEHSATKATQFAAWRGAPIDNVVAFTSRSNWSAQLNNWWAGSVPAGFSADRDDFILSVPLWTDDGSAGTDQNWRDLGAEIAAVDPDGLVRLGWEMNCCFSHATNATTWRDQFSRAVTLMRSTAPGLQIVFNPNEGAAQNGTVRAIESLYVQGKVDIIALDTYDWWSPFTTKENVNSHFTKKYGWDFWYGFARDHGLPFALGEFSVSAGSSAGGGDNPRFFEVTYDWLMDKQKADPGSIRFVALFDDSATYCGCAISSTQNPKAAAKYRSLISQISAG